MRCHHSSRHQKYSSYAGHDGSSQQSSNCIHAYPYCIMLSKEKSLTAMCCMVFKKLAEVMFCIPGLIITSLFPPSLSIPNINGGAFSFLWLPDHFEHPKQHPCCILSTQPQGQHPFLSYGTFLHFLGYRKDPNSSFLYN